MVPLLLHKRDHRFVYFRDLEHYLQAELNDARLKGAGDDTTTGGSTAQRSTQTTRRQVQVCVVEDVVELCAELHLHALDWCGELLVQSKVRLVERRCATRITRCIAKGAQQCIGWALGCRQ